MAVSESTLLGGVVCEVPRGASPELKWTLQTILDSFLGLRLPMVECDRRATDYDVRIVGLGKRLLLPSGSFCPELRWEDMPRPNPPAVAWDPKCSGLSPILADGTVAVPVGSYGCRREAGALQLELDVLGTAFRLLTLLDEQHAERRDSHGRVLAENSLAVQTGWECRPIVDEHVEVLRSALCELWPGLVPPPRVGSLKLTCDVDHARDPAGASIRGYLRRVIGVAMGRRDDLGPIAAARRSLAVRMGRASDPYVDSVEWLMDLAEADGGRATFYFIPMPTDPRMDNGASLQVPPYRQIARLVAERKHCVGVHPGYRTMEDKQTLEESVAQFRRDICELGPDAVTEVHSRQHYLRWCPRSSPASLEAAGIAFDSTIGFTDRIGFRSGTAREFAMWDPVGRRCLALRQQPLIAMDAAFLPAFMRGAWEVPIQAALVQVGRSARAYGGCFRVLCHNSELNGARTRRLVAAVIARVGGPSSAA